MPAINRGTSRGQLVPLVFGQTDLAVSQTDVQLVTAIGESGQTGDAYVAPFDGEIVAVGWNLTAAATAGTLSVGAAVNGTEDADTTIAVPIDATTVRGYKRIPRGLAPFVANDQLGAEITTNGAFAPITADLVVTVWVLLYLDGV